MNDRLEFLRDRSKGMGGTDMPTLLGIDERRNALDLYYQKTRPVEDDGEDWRGVDILRGNLLEDTARLRYFEETGRQGRANTGATHHPDYPAFNCHLDFTIYADDERPEGIRGTGVGETKCPRARVMDNIVDKGIRESTLVQGMTYAAVARREWCGLNLFSLEWGGGMGWPGPTLPIDVPADAELGRLILETGQEFWDRHVETRTPPTAVDIERYAKLGDEVAGAAREVVRESTGELYEVDDAAFAELVAKHMEDVELAKTLEEAAKERKERIQAWIEEHSPSDRVIVPGVSKITVVRSSGRRYFSDKSLKLHRPIDRDKFIAFLAAGRPELSGASLDALLEELELDLSLFEREGTGFSYPKFTKVKR